MWGELSACSGLSGRFLESRLGAYQDLSKFVVVEITTTIRNIAQEVPLGRAEGMAKRCVANCDNLRTVPRSALVRKAGVLAPRRHAELKHAVGYALGWTELLATTERV